MQRMDIIIKQKKEAEVSKEVLVWEYHTRMTLMRLMTEFNNERKYCHHQTPSKASVMAGNSQAD